MNKTLLLPLAALCAIPQMNAQQLNSPKVHEVTLSSQKHAGVKLVDKINPVRVAAQTSDLTLDESFESDDRTFPEGWTVKNTNANDWIVYSPIMMGITPPDGYYSAMGTCIDLHDEAWLVSPEITPREGEQLMFDLYFDVRSLYVWTTTGDDKNIDEEDGLILKRENAENMKICVSVDGGEWILLKNLWEEYGQLGYHLILDEYAAPEYRPFVFPLDEFVGKKIKIGFCHQYLDERFGHGMLLDAVKVCLPPVETSYQLPFGMMFWGMSNDFQGLPGSALAPMYTEMTWINDDSGSDYKFSWAYSCYSNDKSFTSTQEDLTTVFTPDYSTDPESAFTIYTFPTLTTTDNAGTTGEYTYGDGYAFIYAGAEAALPTRDGGVMNFGLATFDLNDDFQIYNADFSTPAWGHNAMTTEWWTNHFFDGDQGTGDCVEVVSNLNFFYSNGAPMVIDGVRVAASVVCEDDAEFTLQLIELNEDFTMGNVLAEKTIKGSELVKIDASVSPFPEMSMLCFNFENPVVVDGKNFVTKISGFNSEKVTYYATLQSYEPRELCYAFAGVEITAPSVGRPDTRESLMPASLDDNYGSFAMYLDARYPWLVCNDAEFEASKDANSKVFEFDSSYPAEELMLSVDGGNLPEWLKVEKTGRYGNTRLTVVVTDGSEDNETANLNVSAPGVNKVLTIKRGNWSSGLSQAAVSSEVVERQCFDLSGRRLSAEPQTGVCIIKNIHANGSVTVEKMVK